MGLLEDARKRLHKKEEGIEKARSEVANLETIVSGVGTRIKGDRLADAEALSPTVTTVLVGAGASIRRGLPTLTSVIRQIMADGQPRNADAIYAELQSRGEETAAQGSKPQIANRLVELTQQGYLERPERGIYKLASAEANQNDAGREGPLLPVQPGVQKSPGEEVASPRQGHPDDVEGAPGVAHQAGI